jgi:hypothetical protein
MAGFSPKGPGISGTPRVPKAGSTSGGPRFQQAVRAPTNFPRVKVSRRDYAKPEMGAEQPLGVSEGSKSSFGSTGLTGES